MGVRRRRLHMALLWARGYTVLEAPEGTRYVAIGNPERDDEFYAQQERLWQLLEKGWHPWEPRRPSWLHA